MALRAAVVGASGYAGAELIRLLTAHPALEVGMLAAERHAGRPVGDLHPNLEGVALLGPVDTDQLAEHDVVFLATPADVARELVPALTGAGTAVVDLSDAFRGSDTVYGLTEWTRDRVRGARLVANPGCYPTAALLGLLPLADLVVAGSVIVDAKSGTSGAGRGLRDDLHASHVHGDVAAYGAPGHRHTAEIERHLGALAGQDLGPVQFTPHLLPIARGLLATCYARLADGVDAGLVDAALTAAYADEPFVTVLPSGTFPHVKAVAASNACHVSAVVDPRTRRVVVSAAIDNLGKGAAGQALQNANLILGLDESTGLSPVGVYP